MFAYNPRFAITFNLLITLLVFSFMLFKALYLSLILYGSLKICSTIPSLSLGEPLNEVDELKLSDLVLGGTFLFLISTSIYVGQEPYV